MVDPSPTLQHWYQQNHPMSESIKSMIVPKWKWDKGPGRLRHMCTVCTGPGGFWAVLNLEDQQVTIGDLQTCGSVWASEVPVNQNGIHIDISNGWFEITAHQTSQPIVI